MVQTFVNDLQNAAMTHLNSFFFLSKDLPKWKEQGFWTTEIHLLAQRLAELSQTMSFSPQNNGDSGKKYDI